MSESCFGVGWRWGGKQPLPSRGQNAQVSSGRGTLGACFHKANSSVPSWRGRGTGRVAPVSSPSQVPILARECEAGWRGDGTVPSPGLTPAGRRLAGRAPGSSPGPGSPPPAPRAPPDPGGRARRRPMSALAVSGSRAGSARLALGTRWAAAGGAWGGPRAWLGQACCWVTGRRVSPGNGGGYRSLAGREGGGARAQAGPADPSNSARPPPRRGAVTFTRAGRSDPADTRAPARLRSSLPAWEAGCTEEPRRALPTVESQDSGPAVKS